MGGSGNLNVNIKACKMVLDSWLVSDKAKRHQANVPQNVAMDCVNWMECVDIELGQARWLKRKLHLSIRGMLMYLGITMLMYVRITMLMYLRKTMLYLRIKKALLSLPPEHVDRPLQQYLMYYLPQL